MAEFGNRGESGKGSKRGAIALCIAPYGSRSHESLGECYGVRLYARSVKKCANFIGECWLLLGGSCNGSEG